MLSSNKVLIDKKHKKFTRMNEQIRSEEVRVIGSDGEALGVMKTPDAIKKAQNSGLDLIEISPEAKPPVVKITDYGKFQYEKKKKDKVKTKGHTTETKTIQIKINTGEHDLELKAKRASEWLKEKDRVKLELYLRGRSKYMEKEFLEGRLNRILKLLTENYKVADGPKKGPKGLTMILEHDQNK